MKVITKDIPIYHGYFRIVITENFTEAVKKFKIDTDGINVEHYGAFVRRGESRNDDNPITTLVIRPDILPDLVAHEAVHLTNAVFLYANIQLDRNNDEPQAYMTGWFVSEIYKALNKY